MRKREPPLGRGSATRWRLILRRGGPRSEMNRRHGSRRAVSYRWRLAWNQSRELFFASSRRNRKSSGEKWLTSATSAPQDSFRQRRHAAEQPRVEGALAAVILLVGDAVMHPGQARPHLSVEAADVLEHVELPRQPDLLLPVRVRLAQRRQQRGLRPPAGDPTPVLVEEPLVGFAAEIPVGASELAGHHETGLDDVLHELQRRAGFRRRAEGEIFVGEVAQLVDHAVAREPPRLERFLQQCRESLHFFTSGIQWRPTVMGEEEACSTGTVWDVTETLRGRSSLPRWQDVGRTSAATRHRPRSRARDGAHRTPSTGRHRSKGEAVPPRDARPEPARHADRFPRPRGRGSRDAAATLSKHQELLRAAGGRETK